MDSQNPNYEISTQQEIGRFIIKLGEVYFYKGYVNPGVEVSHLFGAHGEAVTIYFSDGAPSIVTKINRNAVKNKAVRFSGSNSKIAEWFQEHFDLNDEVEVRILSLNEVEFLTPNYQD